MSSNFFEDLGLSPHKEYSKEELKKRYRDLCKKHHPDVGGSAEDFNKINHAYNMLTDPEYRHNQEKHKIKLDINFTVPILFEDAFFGKSIPISFNKFELEDDGKLMVKEHQEVVSLIVHYPQGTMAGYTKTVKGAGMKHRELCGDAHITFAVKQHPRYQIDGQGHIMTQEKIELEIMLKGGEIEVQTLFGLKTLKVPPGTKPGDKLIIKNCGALRRAHHVVDPQPIFPTKAELKKKQKFNDLTINWDDFKEEQEERNQGYVIQYFLPDSR